MRHMIANSRGFTLAEVIIASMVLIVALLVIPRCFRWGTSKSRRRPETLAVTAGRQILEDIGALPFDSIRNLNNFNTGSSEASRERPDRAARRGGT